MKHRSAIAAGLILAGLPLLRAQLNIPSDGSDGAFSPTSNTIVNLANAVTGLWNDNNSANTGKGIWDPAKKAIVFKYTSVNIPSGVTVTFANHPNRPPVVWLVSGNVTINGTLSLNGQNAGGSDFLAEPGPGGFRGGASGGSVGGAGLGIAGGALASPLSGAYAASYGNTQIVPLIGGSGGYRGGGGGGAILIASSGTITVGGEIRSNGGSGIYVSTGSGSSGAIRLVADKIAGSGILDASNDGRLRLEAKSVPSGTLRTYPSTIAVAPLVAPGTSVPILWPAEDAPTCRIYQVGDTENNVPANPTAALGASVDVGINVNSNVPVKIRTTNFPVDGTGVVQVRVAGKFVGNATWVTATLDAGGTFATATWTASVNFVASAYTTLQAKATVE